MTDYFDLIINTSNGKSSQYSPSIVGFNFDTLFVNLDYDQLWSDGQFHVSRPTRNHDAVRFESLPATAILEGTTNLVPMTRDIQEWIYGLCWNKNALSEVEAKSSFKSLFRNDAYATNKFGTTTCADYINGTNLNKGLPRLIPMVCGGATLKPLGEKTIFGISCWEIQTINCLGDYRFYNPLEHPWLFYQPINSARRKIMDANNNWTGKWMEFFSNPFSQFGEKSIVPLMTYGTNIGYIPKYRCQIIKARQPIPNKFVRG